jgi:phage terminase large subunit
LNSLSLQIPEPFGELFNHHRYKVYYGGRGGAKSWNFARVLVLEGYQRQIRVLCAREVQNSIRQSVHKLLSEQIDMLGLSSFYEVTERTIRGKNGTEFIFEGLSRNVDKIKSMEGIDRCWVEEAQTVSEESWKLLIPTIRKPGSEIWVSFNPRLKTDATYQRFVVHPPPDAVVKKVGWQDNPWFPDELMGEMEHLKRIDFDEYEHVWEGQLKEFADGAIYGKELKTARREGRILKIPLERGIPINTFWDLGRNDTTAIWFHQRVGLENRFLWTYEHNFVGLDHYVKYLHEWAAERDMFYGEHFLPHDAEVTELIANKSRKEMLEEGKIKPIIVVPRINVISEGIEQTRRQLHSCYFDEEGCEGGLDALANYQYAYDENNAAYRQAPLHNWASNYADAFRQFGQGYAPNMGWAGQNKKVDHRRALPRNSEGRNRNRFSTDASWRV